MVTSKYTQNRKPVLWRIERKKKKNEDENGTLQAANSQHLFATNEKDENYYSSSLS